jgi:putative nucleotidyltransferase with HDIG domain
MAEAASPIRVLAVGLDPLSVKACLRALVGQELVESVIDLEKLIESPLDPPPAIVLCGPPPEGISANELAQALRMVYAEAPIHYVTTLRSGFERKVFQKNGFTDAFLLPIDIPVLESTIRDDLSKVSKGACKSYKAVKMVDLEAGATLEFDTYIHLPGNNKHIKLTAAGDSLDEDRLARFKKREMNSLHVAQDQMPKFYEFTAKQLKKIQGSPTLSATEKSEKIQAAVRDIMGGIFNDSSKEASTTHGKSIVADCAQIVKAYVLTSDVKGASGPSWYEKILTVADSSTNSYSHSANVATYAAMFSLGLSMGKPEEVAMAALLHDVGLADVPLEIQLKPAAERSKAEEDEYRKHTEYALKIIRDRKLIVSETVLKAISQHHERFNGTGYPKGTTGPRICPEAQILALADEFDYLTGGAVEGGTKKMTPSEALQHLITSNASVALFDQALLNKLAALFGRPTAAAKVA